MTAPPGLVRPRPLCPARTVLVGTRALDAAEAGFIKAAEIAVVAPADVVDAVGTSKAYVHIDLDVLDPVAYRLRSWRAAYAV